MTHLHSHAHLFELTYRAIAAALNVRPDPLSRSADGRFISRKETKSRQLREEMQSIAHLPLGEAIAVLNRQRGAGE